MWIEVLGPVRLIDEAGRPVDVAERSLRVLLASLVAADGDPVPADVLVDRLWDEEMPQQPRKVLRAKLSRLRATMERARSGARELLQHTPAGYRLEVGDAEVDTRQFAALLGKARGAESSLERERLLGRALDLWRGRPYGDIADALWIAPVTAALDDSRGDALESLISSQLEQGEPERALTWMSILTESYPTRERAVTVMMAALYQVGRQGEALAMFETLRRRLAEEFGVDPGPEVHQLHARILRQDRVLTSSVSAGAESRAEVGRRAPAVPPVAGSNLPAETAPLIGRHREVQEAKDLLRTSRLVTLTGIGGVGKTRLALHLARSPQMPGERGPWFVDLSELPPASDQGEPSGERIATAVARELELSRRDPGTSDLGQLIQVLGGREALLVLDNCEHVGADAAVFVLALLRRAPRMRVLATSREPLGLPEEQLMSVATLATEREGGRGFSVAAEFFACRARAVDPSFQLDESTLEAVTELCRRLDGLPLALELAAARIRGISVEDLLERLSDRLNLLRRPGRAAPRRQQTLRGMMEWSWSLLDAREQAVLRRLAVHPGTLTLAGAEATCSESPGTDGKEASTAIVRGDIADVLLGLVERSLVTTTACPGAVRYGMLETVATFAAEKLYDAAERPQAARRHLDHYIALAREANQNLRGPEQGRWLSRLGPELAQLRHAFEEAARSGDGGRAAALTAASFWYQWILGGHADLAGELEVAAALPGPQDDDRAVVTVLSACMRLEEDPEWASERVTRTLEDISDGTARARAGWFAGVSLLAVGRHRTGIDFLEEAITSLDRNDQEWDLAVAVSQRDWFLAGMWGHRAHGLPDGRDPEQVLRGLGDGWGLNQALSVKHRIAETRGDQPRAEKAAREALEIALRFELWADASDWFSATATNALRAGDRALAIEHLDRATSLASDLTYDHGMLAGGLARSMLARDDGELDHAQELLSRWIGGFGQEAARDPNTFIEAGFLAAQQAEPGRVERALETLRDITPQDAAPPLAASTLELEAAVHALHRRPGPARELLDEAASVRDRSDAPTPYRSRRDHDRIRALVGGAPQDVRGCAGAS